VGGAESSFKTKNVVRFTAWLVTSLNVAKEKRRDGSVHVFPSVFRANYTVSLNIQNLILNI
jgi:hypothetical protein